MKKRLYAVLFLIGIFALFLISAGTMQTEPPGDLTDLSAVLVWIASGIGGPFIVAYAFAMLAEYWVGWHSVNRWVKFTIGVVVSVLLALGAQFLLSKPAVVDQIQPIFAIIVTAVIAWVGQQMGIAKSNRDGLNATAKRLANGK